MVLLDSYVLLYWSRKLFPLPPCIMVVSPESLYKTECDIISPCALGGAINSSTRDLLKCKAIVGAANNQLDTFETGEWLLKNNIIYYTIYFKIYN